MVLRFISSGQVKTFYTFDEKIFEFLDSRTALARAVFYGRHLLAGLTVRRLGHGKKTSWDERDCGQRDLHGNHDLWNAGRQGGEFSDYG